MNSAMVPATGLRYHIERWPKRISPLMGPIMAMGLALAAGDLYLGIRAAANLAASVAA